MGSSAWWWGPAGVGSGDGSLGFCTERFEVLDRDVCRGLDRGGWRFGAEHDKYAENRCGEEIGFSAWVHGGLELAGAVCVAQCSGEGARQPLEVPLDVSGTAGVVGAELDEVSYESLSCTPHT